jgi:hypothetical protein
MLLIDLADELAALRAASVFGLQPRTIFLYLATTMMYGQKNNDRLFFLAEGKKFFVTRPTMGAPAHENFILQQEDCNKFYIRARSCALDLLKELQHVLLKDWISFPSIIFTFHPNRR